MKCKVVDTKQGTIEYRSIGTGNPVLVVHGGHSNCQDELTLKWFDQKKFKLIIPSRPGYGETPLRNQLTAEQAARLLISLVEYLKIDKVVVYGVSAGGPTAISIAANFPSRVTKLILASAVTRQWLNKQGSLYRTAQLTFNPWTEYLTWVMARFFFSISPKLVSKSFYQQMSTYQNHQINSIEIKELSMMLNRCRSKKGFMVDIDHHTAQGEISGIMCPTLVLHSKYDKSVPYEHAEYAMKMIRNAELVALENAWGHLIWIGADTMLAQQKITTFLSS